jgi:plastocyanin
MRITFILPLALTGLAFSAARAEEPIKVPVAIKDHRFDPAELRVPAGKPFVLEVTNEDVTPEEVESKPLKFEKVVPGNKAATVRVRSLEKGRYRFFGEYHEATAQGVVIAE